jgi:excinuclease UvrABC ATPase subunit
MVVRDQEYIEIRGARENNLRNVSLRIPKRQITIFTGVSGSGKSSIVFDTISAEAQRQLNETFTAFVRNFLPHYAQPEADAIENLSTAIVVDQKRLGGNSRSTMGTITDIFAIIRLLFSRIGQPHIGPSYMFSFNVPSGMCPECDGLGRKVALDLNKFLDTSKSLSEGAVRLPMWNANSWYIKGYMNTGFFDNDKPLKDYTEEEWNKLLYSKEGKVQYQTKGGEIESSYEGLVEKFNRLYIKQEFGERPESTMEKINPFLTDIECPLCHGARLNQAALSAKINGKNIADYAAMEVSDLIKELRTIDDPIGAPVVASAIERLQQVEAIGLGYLSLDRETTTLSGGESQRIKMVKHLSSSLVDLMYIFDEPSIGLHPRDVHLLNDLLRQLRDKGNTVIVVEHDRDVIEIADYIFDIGPKAGVNGGEIVYEGSVEGLLQADTLTGQFMQRHLPLKTNVRKPTGRMTVKNATVHNLKNVTVDIPEGVLTVITGVAGSGKSSLIHYAFLSQYPDAVVVDQGALSTNVRSTPATYTGMMDEIRKQFAKANDVNASLFSFNSKGACPNCQGLGFIYTDLAFMDPIRTPCEICEGKRFNDEVLSYELRGKNINDVLEMPMREALDFFQKTKLNSQLEKLVDVGLDYLKLGQPLSTLSGGECQRVKLAQELNKKGSIYIMDEPTTGLHMSDVGRLLDIMDKLVDSGNSVIVIEHNVDVIKNADWIIDMGPEAGHLGGEVVFEGTPEEIIHSERSLTGQYLRQTAMEVQ